MSYNAYYFINALYNECNKLEACMKKDWLFSPIGITLQMALALDGADGTTLTELLKAMGFTDVSDKEKVHDLLKSEFYQKLAESKTKKLANVIALSEQYPMKQDYTNEQKSYYNAVAVNVDYSNADTAAGQINQKIEWATSHLIKEVVKSTDIPEDTLLMLVNAVIFCDVWANCFLVKDTKIMKFHAPGGDKEIPFMYKCGSMGYSELKQIREHFGLTGVRMKFKEGMSLVVVSSSKPEGLQLFNEELATSRGKEYLKVICSNSSYQEKKVKLWLPRFGLDFQLGLKEVLEPMGINDAFSDAANFEKMADGKFSLSQVISKSVLKVNENGVAGTTWPNNSHTCSAVISKDVKVENPFLVALVTDGSDFPLFIGNVWNPEDPGVAGQNDWSDVCGSG